MYNIIIIDDHPIVLEGIKSSFSSTAEVSIMREFRDARVALSFIRGNHETIDLVITDLDLPGMDGFKFIEKAHSIKPSLKMVVFSFFIEKSSIESIKQLNINAFISKEESVSILPRVVLSVFAGKEYYSFKVRGLLEKKSDTYQLSKIQTDIVKFLAQGKTAKEISLELKKSNRTIEYHAAKLRKQFNVRNNLELLQKLKSQNVF